MNTDSRPISLGKRCRYRLFANAAINPRSLTVTKRGLDQPVFPAVKADAYPSAVGPVGLPIITATQGAALAQVGQMQHKPHPDGLPIITSGQIGNNWNPIIGQTAAHLDHAALDTYFAAQRNNHTLSANASSGW